MNSIYHLWLPYPRVIFSNIKYQPLSIYSFNPVNNCLVLSIFRKYDIYFSKGFLTFKYYITAFAFCFDNFFPFVNNWSVSALSVGFSYTCPDPMERSGYPEVANLYIYLVVPTLLHLQFKECKEIPHKSFRALLLLVQQHNFQIP